LHISDDLKKLLILSTGRTGSTFISKGLSDSVDNRTIEHQITGSRIINVLGNLVCAQRLSLPKAKLVSNGLLGFDLQVSTSDPLRSMLLYAQLQSKEMRPDVLIVHVIRDPRDFVTSFMNWKNQSLKRRILHHVVPFWQPSPWLAGEISFYKRFEMNKFEHFCWIWNYKNRLFEKLERYFNYQRFKFEHLFNDSREAEDERQDLFLFLGTKMDDVIIHKEEKINSSKGSFDSWSSWTPEQAALLDKHCGELMKKYGYGNEPEWIALLEG